MTLVVQPETAPLRVDKDGVIRIGNTRVLLELVIETFNDGFSPEEIVMQYSTLSLADVYAVIAYYLRHKDEVEAYLRQSEQEATEIRQKIEAHQNLTGIRERLLARKAAQDQDGRHA